MLVERGIPIIEMLSLETLSARGGLLFDFVISPLPLLGATGSPVRPLAVFEVNR
jgi:kynurenine formamidase